jgi:hypothetical protein
MTCIDYIILQYLEFGLGCEHDNEQQSKYISRGFLLPIYIIFKIIPDHSLKTIYLNHVRLEILIENAMIEIVVRYKKQYTSTIRDSISKEGITKWFHKLR